MIAVHLVLLTLLAMVHDDSWINHGKLYDPQSQAWCCNEKDCEDITQQGILVTEKLDGFVIADSGEYVPGSRVLWKSPDGHWWRCHIIVHEQGRTWKKARCLIAPPSSS